MPHPLAGSFGHLSSSTGVIGNANMARNQSPFEPSFDPSGAPDPTSFVTPSNNIGQQEMNMASRDILDLVQPQLGQLGQSGQLGQLGQLGQFTWVNPQNVPHLGGLNNTMLSAPLAPLEGGSSISMPAMASQASIVNSGQVFTGFEPLNLGASTQWPNASQSPMSSQSTDYGDSQALLTPTVTSQLHPQMLAHAQPPSRSLGVGQGNVGRAYPKVNTQNQSLQHPKTNPSTDRAGPGSLLPAHRPKTLVDRLVHEGEILVLGVMRDPGGREIPCTARCSFKNPHTFVDIDFAKRNNMDRPIPKPRRRAHKTSRGMKEPKRYCELHVPIKIGSKTIEVKLCPQLDRPLDKGIQMELGTLALGKLGLIRVTEGTFKCFNTRFRLPQKRGQLVLH